MTGGNYTIPFVHVTITEGQVRLYVGELVVRTWPESLTAKAEASMLAALMRDEIKRGMAAALARALDIGTA